MTAPTGVASVIATDAPTAPVPTTAPTTIISTTTPSTGSVTASTNILPVAFEVNQGQAADDVSYVAHAVGYTALFNGQGMTVPVLSADGRSLVYSTYLDGGAYDEGHALALDPQGDAYIVGMTEGTASTAPTPPRPTPTRPCIAAPAPPTIATPF